MAATSPHPDHRHDERDQPLALVRARVALPLPLFEWEEQDRSSGRCPLLVHVALPLTWHCRGRGTALAVVCVSVALPLPVSIVEHRALGHPRSGSPTVDSPLPSDHSRGGLRLWSGNFGNDGAFSDRGRSSLLDVDVLGTACAYLNWDAAPFNFRARRLTATPVGAAA